MYQELENSDNVIIDKVDDLFCLNEHILKSYIQDDYIISIIKEKYIRSTDINENMQ